MAITVSTRKAVNVLSEGEGRHTAGLDDEKRKHDVSRAKPVDERATEWSQRQRRDAHPADEQADGASIEAADLRQIDQQERQGKAPPDGVEERADKDATGVSASGEGVAEHVSVTERVRHESDVRNAGARPHRSAAVKDLGN
jgi:hypothetical protein